MQGLNLRAIAFSRGKCYNLLGFSSHRLCYKTDNAHGLRVSPWHTHSPCRHLPHIYDVVAGRPCYDSQTNELSESLHDPEQFCKFFSLLASGRIPSLLYHNLLAFISWHVTSNSSLRILPGILYRLQKNRVNLLSLKWQQNMVWKMRLHIQNFPFPK